MAKEIVTTEGGSCEPKEDSIVWGKAMVAKLAVLDKIISGLENGVEEFMKKAEQVKNDNMELAKENDSLKKRIAELEEKLKNK